MEALVNCWLKENATERDESGLLSTVAQKCKHTHKLKYTRTNHKHAQYEQSRLPLIQYLVDNKIHEL